MPKPGQNKTEFFGGDAEAEKAPVQGYVDADLRKQVIDQMKLDKKAGIKITWDKLLEGGLKAYLAERKNAN